MSYYTGKAERERKDRDTPERILHLAKLKGEFRISLRWRDLWLQERCRELREAGLLVGGKRKGRELVYYPTANPPHPTNTGEQP